MKKNKKTKEELLKELEEWKIYASVNNWKQYYHEVIGESGKEENLFYRYLTPVGNRVQINVDIDDGEIKISN